MRRYDIDGHIPKADTQPWKVRRVPGTKQYQVCTFSGDGTVKAAFRRIFGSPEPAQIFADKLNKEVFDV